MLTYALGFFQVHFITLFLIIGTRLLLIKGNTVDKTATSFTKLILFTTFIYTLAGYFELYYAGLSEPTIYRKVLSVIGYALGPLIILFFIRVVTHGKKLSAALYIIPVLNALVYCTTFIPEYETLAFTYDTLNNFTRGPLGFTSHIVSFVFIFILLIVVLIFKREKKNDDAIVVLLCATATVVAILVETLSSSKGILSQAIVASCLFYYIFLYSRASRAQRQEKELLLSDQRAAMVVSEIRPRFIVEVLKKLKGLPTTKPRQAEDIIENLTYFLEKNMETIDFIHPIPFEEELQRATAYLKLEQTRLPRLKIEYQIEDMEFMIPALTLQQILENSIIHGLEDQEDGTVFVKTFLSDTGHTIIVQDNGKGFDDVLAYTSENQGSRFGISNVMDRLERMCGGELNIVSKPGTGTTVMISIPKN